MKMNKIVLGLLIILTVVLVPRLSVSKTAGNSETVVLSASNTLVLNSEVNGDSVGELMLKAKQLDSKLSGHLGGDSQKPLYLFLDTPGGSIQSGLELIEAFQGLGRPVHTITLFSASMGFQIAQNLGDRLILKNGVLMSHHAAGEIQGSFGGVSPSQMDSRYKLWIDRIRELDEQTVKRTNGKQTYESYTKEYDHEMWLTGTQSIAEGYADRIVTVKCDKTLTGVQTKHVSFLGMDVGYDIDNCPINTNPMNVRVGSLDGKTMINQDTIDQVKAKFLAQFQNKQSQVVPMYW